MELSVGFGPFHFSWVVLGLEVLVAFWPAEPEDFAVISDESHAVAWVDGGRAEVTLLDSHDPAKPILQ